MKKIAKVVTTTTTTPPATRKRTQTDAQAVHTSLVTMLGTVWNSMSNLERDSWVGMSQQLHGSNASTIGTQPKISPYLTFVSANTAHYNVSGTVQRVASPAPIMPAPIPPGLLNAAWNPEGGLSLTLVTPSYFYPVLVYGAAPVPAGQNIYKTKGAFKLLGSVPGGLVGSTDLSALYNAKFRTNAGSGKIALKLVGVSPSGTRTAEQFLSGVIAAPAATAAKTDAPSTEGTALKVA